MNLPTFPFTVLDTETTGLIPRVHTVIEFASVRIENGKIVDEYTQLFSIAEELPAVTKALTRIHQNDLTGQPTFLDKRETILSHIGTDTLIMGQNVGFDIAMLKGAGLDISDRPWIDTSMISSLVFPELDSYSLGYVSTLLGLHHEPVHRALGDVHATLELIERCWKRLQEVPEELLGIARNTGKRSAPAYKLFFSSIPVSTKKKQPAWLKIPHSASSRSTGSGPAAGPSANYKLQKPERGVVDLVEEPLEPGFLQGVINACSEDPDTIHWIAVKNLERTVRTLHIPKHARILWPPFLLPDTRIAGDFAHQESFTADETTLAIKLAWYEPRSRADLPIHGNERFVWNGKTACTDTSLPYIQQFTELPHTLIIDHRQLLAFLADPAHAAHNALNEKTHIIIDDASVLEETATKAYGWSLNLDDLRAAAIGDATLIQFTDLLQLWIEKTRAMKDTFIITQKNLTTPDVHGLVEQLLHLIKKTLSPQLSSTLKNLHHFLEIEGLPQRIEWIECRQDGGQIIHSVPECIDKILRSSLYEKFATTLFIPPESAGPLREVLPPQTSSRIHRAESLLQSCTLSFSSPDTLEHTLTNPPKGKTIILMPGKHAIEQVFITHAESLEEKGVTLFCQGFSGGQGRFQSEFAACRPPALLLITPWIFEGLELPPDSLDHLVITTLPFDSPLYPTIARRSLHYKNPFLDYALPRLEQRLFRIIRTFCQFARPESIITVTDERLETKKYGKEVKKYLQSLIPSSSDKKNQMELF
ncbi:hypothetical protein HYZ98_03935 [Candidatus Peregrinibacteria bacterium]|nr:hypothetical protein [Candidatus Peregrinibacteria bacterium]